MSRIFRVMALTLFSCALLPALRADDPINALITPPNRTEMNGHQIIGSMFPYLDVTQRAEFEHALYPALDKNPQLVTDGIALLQAGGKKSGDVSPADFEAYKKSMAAYEVRLRQAMLAEDPAIGAIFDEIDAHMKLQSNP